MDLHPADGVYSNKPGCTQWHSKGVYQIPYRCMYSRNIRNLFLAGRDISVTHVAFGSTRVMATCAHNAQAIGMASAMCRMHGLLPRDLLDKTLMRELQQRLLRSGQYIPEVAAEDAANLARTARATASSCFTLDELKPSGDTVSLESARAMLVPAATGSFPRVTFRLDATQDAEVEVQLRIAERTGNFTPDVILAQRTLPVTAGKNRTVTVDFETRLDRAQYVFICLMACPQVQVYVSDQRVTGVLALVHGANRKVAKSAVQRPPEGIGVESFEFWIPERRPSGRNLAIAFDPPLELFAAVNVLQGPTRPTIQANAWVAAPDDPAPRLTLAWTQPQHIGQVELVFDTDADHAMEPVQWGHPESAMPFCVRHYRILDAHGAVLAECTDNHQARNAIRLPAPVTTDRLVIECLETCGGTPAALFQVRCYST